MTDAENDQQLSAVLAQPADKAIAAIGAGDFSAPDLERLAELEVDGKDRTTVKDAIAGAMNKQAADAQGEQPEPKSTNDAAMEGGAGDGDTDASSAGGKEARGEEVPDWMKPDYTGPLTGDQAMWRNANIRTK